MSTYYKYAEQSADSQVNWAEVSKSVSDMLTEEVKIREQKKAAIDDAFQKDMQNLSSAPQGKWQDGNKFTNDYAHGLTQMQLNDYKLLKSGQMSVQDYTLRRQNYVNGTNTLFDLQKSYQNVYDDRMQGILSGKYQAMTGAEMAQVEGFKDFSNSRAVIDPYTGIVNVGKLVKNPTTGVMELSKDVVPVNVLKGKINTPIPAWDADGAINNIVGKLGENVEFLYNAAGTTRAGTITKLLGLGALQGEYAKVSKDGKPLYPQFKDSIDNINKGINDAISSAFSNPYNISSVLTQNTGNYNQDSFTYDKNVAANDKGKILLKIDSTTGLSTLDKDSPNFKAQEQEARDWVKGQMLSKMDNKRELSTTATTPYGPQASEASIARGIAGRDAIKDAQTIGSLWGGNQAQIQKAVTRFRDMNPNIKEVNRTDKGVFVTLNVDGVRETRDLPFYGPDGRVLSQAEFIESASNLLTGNTNLTDAISRGGYLKGAVFNPSTKASATVQTQGGTQSGLPPAPMTNRYLLGGSAPAGSGVGAQYNVVQPQK
jgi:hypothetical protein